MPGVSRNNPVEFVINPTALEGLLDDTQFIPTYEPLRKKYLGTTEVRPQHRANVVTYPTEKGFNVSEHVFLDTTTVEVALKFYDKYQSDSDFIRRGFSRHEVSESRDDQLKFVELLYKKKIRFKFISDVIVLPDVVISSFSPEQKHTSQNTYDCSITLHEIVTATIQEATFQVFTDIDGLVVESSPKSSVTLQQPIRKPGTLAKADKKKPFLRRAWDGWHKGLGDFIDKF